MVSEGVRLFSWYRVIALLLLVLFGGVSFVYSYAPSLVFQSFYPLKYEEQIKRASSSFGLDPYLVAAVIRTESNWDAGARSGKGAEGLMQLLPETAQDMVRIGYVDGSSYRSDNLMDPDTNIEFGCAYLAYLLKYFNGATDKAIAAYNAGMGNVDSWTQDDTLVHSAITFPETQAYLARVRVALSRYQDLYPDSFM